MNDETISRQTAIDALIELSEQRDEWDNNEGYAQKRGIDAAICAIEDLPSAERQEVQSSECEYWDDESNFCTLYRPSAERRGSWVGIDDEPCEVWECDQCGHIVERECPPRFCEECGARMEASEWTGTKKP